MAFAPALERFEVGRDPMVGPQLFQVGTLQAVGGIRHQKSGVRVEWRDVSAMAALRAAWADLLQRAIDPNVFLDPAFALPLLRDGRSDVAFLIAWDTSNAEERLVGLLPVQGRPTARLLRGFHHPQVTLGTPLLDTRCGGAAFETMLAWLRDQPGRGSGLILTAIPTESAFFTALMARCAVAGRSIVVLDPHRRAVLRRDLRPTDGEALSSKRRKELRRQRRRLEDFGALSYSQASDPIDVAAAVERFLALEAGGWKGRRKTAFLADPRLADFLRAMTAEMARDGRCRIDSLDVAGAPVAMGIVIRAGSGAYFWKTTFDERFAALSPGVQFARELTRRQDADETIHLTDSCAVPDHPMIDRLWPHRMVVADVVIAFETGPKTAGFAAALRYERLRRWVLGAAKPLAKTLLGLVSRDWSH